MRSAVVSALAATFLTAMYAVKPSPAQVGDKIDINVICHMIDSKETLLYCLQRSEEKLLRLLGTYNDVADEVEERAPFSRVLPPIPEIAGNVAIAVACENADIIERSGQDAKWNPTYLIATQLLCAEQLYMGAYIMHDMWPARETRNLLKETRQFLDGITDVAATAFKQKLAVDEPVWGRGDKLRLLPFAFGRGREGFLRRDPLRTKYLKQMDQIHVPERAKPFMR